MMRRRESSFRGVPQPDSKSGLKFDDIYSLGDVLGKGAYSVVKLGTHRFGNEGVQYAIKCINVANLKPEDVAALKDEVAILTLLRECDHIIRLYDHFDESGGSDGGGGGYYYLILETMYGGELFDRIVSKSCYNEREARDTCIILLDAIEYCHSFNVAHRDLKPENLLLCSPTDDSSIKIADFGFAKIANGPNSLRTQCGTPGYVAPEVIKGEPYDESADMWSVGVILYILLGGYPPFIDTDQRKLFRKIRKGEYEFHEEYWTNVSSDAKDLIRKLLCVDTTQRLTAREALQCDWITKASDAALEKNDMGTNLNELRKFNGKRKFRAAVASVIAVNKLHSFLAFDQFMPAFDVSMEE